MKVSERIDKAIRQSEDRYPRRKHLGASQIGSPCLRKSWYAFRWAYQERHIGRMLRLFQRGHLEEERFVGYLREAGYEVRDYEQRLMYHSGSDSYVCLDWGDLDDPAWMECDDVSEDPVHLRRAASRGEGPQQWSFSDHGGHFAGSGDGKLRGPGLPEGWGLLECKTHNDKSFGALVKKGVVSSKLSHYIQMQIYMHYLDLRWGLYLAVNKNDDSLYEEIVYYKPEVGERYASYANLVFNVEAPPRLTEDASWFECRYCPFREICHYNAPPQKNCRSCVFAKADERGGWYCNHYRQTIPDGFIPEGCGEWKGIK